VVLHETLGPAAGVEKPGTEHGGLRVYSEWALTNSSDPTTPQHRRYVIYAENGSLVQRVRNRASSFDSQPVTVELPPGRYKVVAPAYGYGMVAIPVVVREHQTTLVYLDGSTKPESTADAAAKLVRLPNGMAVGWSDQAR